MARRKKIYWLSYDLGVGGDYKNLYRWLDDHDAKSCGNSVACFIYEYDDSGNPDEMLLEELSNTIDLEPGNKLYIVRSKEDKKEIRIVGSFIYGRRSAAPWEGYGQLGSQEEDE